MSQNVSKAQIQAARRANLYAYLTRYHNSDFIHEGNSIRQKTNHSISICREYAGYKDFSTEETGNAIEFLTRHMGYGFVTAVQSLTAGAATISEGISTTTAQQGGINRVPPKFPPPIDGRYKHLFAYLTNRGISADTIHMLIGQKILYQEKSRNNIVFINLERDFAELRGTYTYGRPFHGIVPNCRHDGFWWFRTSKDASEAYICEAAIDAISLYELHRISGAAGPAYYVSIAGAAKQPAIDRIKQSGLTPILAVDNDDAGQKCRNRNPCLAYILPAEKDWNDDLQALKCTPQTSTGRKTSPR